MEPIALAEDGSDRLWNVIALCADHHREAHSGAHRIKLEQEFMAVRKGKIGT